MKKLTTTVFIQRANVIHNNSYLYTDAIYEGTSIPISIYCTEHGTFSQRPNDHLRGQGCPMCGKINQGNNRRKTTTQFIMDAMLIHGNRYNYSQVEYVSTHLPVTIVCPTHGPFIQKPNLHLSQQCGCPKCGTESHPGRYTSEYFMSEDTKQLLGIFYVIEFSYGNESFIKIGITSTSIKSRYAGKTGVYSMRVLVEVETTLHLAFKKEQQLLEDCDYLSYSPTRKFEGHTECFTHGILEHI